MSEPGSLLFIGFLGYLLENHHDLAGDSAVIQLVKGYSGVKEQGEADSDAVDQVGGGFQHYLWHAITPQGI